MCDDNEPDPDRHYGGNHPIIHYAFDDLFADFQTNQIGVAPFRDRPAHVYPFLEMNEAQRSFLRDIVQSHLDCADDSVRRWSPPVTNHQSMGPPWNDDAKTSRFQNTCTNFASIQMGGNFPSRIIEFSMNILIHF